MPISRRIILTVLYIIGIADLAVLGWAINRMSWPLNAVCVPASLALLLAIYGLVVRVSAKVYCPECKVDGARRAYDAQGEEHIHCSACGYHKPTGYCRPNN